MWSRKVDLGVANSLLPNNVAWVGNFSATSGIGGHSESKAIILHLGAHQANNINVHTERQPCNRALEARIRNLELQQNRDKK